MNENPTIDSCIARDRGEGDKTAKDDECAPFRSHEQRTPAPPFLITPPVSFLPLGLVTSGLSCVLLILPLYYRVQPYQTDSTVLKVYIIVEIVRLGCNKSNTSTYIGNKTYLCLAAIGPTGQMEYKQLFVHESRKA